MTVRELYRLACSATSTTSQVITSDLPDLTDTLGPDSAYVVGNGVFGNVYHYAYRLEGRLEEVAVEAIRVPADWFSAEDSQAFERIPGFGSDYFCLMSVWVPHGTLGNYIRQRGNLFLDARLRLIAAAGLEPMPIDDAHDARLTDFGFTRVLGFVAEQLAYLRSMMHELGGARTPRAWLQRSCSSHLGSIILMTSGASLKSAGPPISSRPSVGHRSCVVRIKFTPVYASFTNARAIAPASVPTFRPDLLVRDKLAAIPKGRIRSSLFTGESLLAPPQEKRMVASSVGAGWAPRVHVTRSDPARYGVPGSSGGGGGGGGAQSKFSRPQSSPNGPDAVNTLHQMNPRLPGA
ncbi:hypothetical protein BS17DRAFT_770471 [Gyrodon lividus]|nr:hypothetical protein BS17DRAFT_770471 [Gyrodon lividus]